MIKNQNQSTAEESRVSTVSSNEISALNRLGGRNRCTFSKNGLCNEHQVMSSTVMVTNREWTGYKWTYKKVKKSVCRARKAGPRAPDKSTYKNDGDRDVVKVTFGGKASQGD